MLVDNYKMKSDKFVKYELFFNVNIYYNILSFVINRFFDIIVIKARKFITFMIYKLLDKSVNSLKKVK